MGVSAPMSVTGEVTISSPGSGSRAAIAVWTAAVPDAQACTYRRPRWPAKRVSSVLTKRPFVLVRVPVRIASATAATSSSPSVRPEASWSDGSFRIGSSRTDDGLKVPPRRSRTGATDLARRDESPEQPFRDPLRGVSAAEGVLHTARALRPRAGSPGFVEEGVEPGGCSREARVPALEPFRALRVLAEDDE